MSVLDNLRFGLLGRCALGRLLVSRVDHRDKPGFRILLKRSGHNGVRNFHQADQFPGCHAEIIGRVLLAEIAAVNVYVFGEWDLMRLGFRQQANKKNKR